MYQARKRILLAEDNTEMRSLVREVLEAQGAHVREASSGVALLSYLAEEADFDLVVTDVRMPWISGAEVITMARAAGYTVPIVVMTAFADEELRRTLARLPAAYLLEKPFGMNELVTRARQLLGLGQAVVAS